MQNAAARLLTGIRKYEHISPILASLHWLPVHFRNQFKILLFVFKSLNGLAPPYIYELLHPYMPTRSLRSTDQLFLNVPKTKHKLRGDHAFAVAAPKLWNDLPLPIRQASSLFLFKSTLKTYIFSLAFDIWCWYLVNYLSLNVFYLYFMSCMSFISLYSTLVHFGVFKCFINKVWLIDWLFFNPTTANLSHGPRFTIWCIKSSQKWHPTYFLDELHKPNRLHSCRF